MEQKRFPVFSERFAELRGEMTQDEFSKFLGISRPTVGFYENGTRIPDALVLRQIAEKCGVSADYLLGLTDVQSLEVNVKAACEYTHLSEKSIERLRFMEKNNKDDFHIVDDLIASDELWRLADNLKETTKFVTSEIGTSGGMRGFFRQFFRQNFLQSYEACYDKLLKKMCPGIEDKPWKEDGDSFAINFEILKWTMRNIPYQDSDEETEE